MNGRKIIPALGDLSGLNDFRKQEMSMELVQRRKYKETISNTFPRRTWKKS